MPNCKTLIARHSASSITWFNTIAEELIASLFCIELRELPRFYTASTYCKLTTPHLGIPLFWATSLNSPPYQPSYFFLNYFNYSLIKFFKTLELASLHYEIKIHRRRRLICSKWYQEWCISAAGWYKVGYSKEYTLKQNIWLPFLFRSCLTFLEVILGLRGPFDRLDPCLGEHRVKPYLCTD